MNVDQLKFALIFVVWRVLIPSWSFLFYKRNELKCERCEKHSPSARASPHFSRVLKNSRVLIVSRNGLLLCVQFVFTTLNNSLLFLVPVRELSRELRVINYNLRKIVGMTNLPFRGEGFGSCALKDYEHRSTHGRQKRFIVRLFHAPAN